MKKLVEKYTKLHEAEQPIEAGDVLEDLKRLQQLSDEEKIKQENNWVWVVYNKPNEEKIDLIFEDMKQTRWVHMTNSIDWNRWRAILTKHLQAEEAPECKHRYQGTEVNGKHYYEPCMLCGADYKPIIMHSNVVIENIMRQLWMEAYEPDTGICISQAGMRVILRNHITSKTEVEKYKEAKNIYENRAEYYQKWNVLANDQFYTRLDKKISD